MTIRWWFALVFTCWFAAACGAEDPGPSALPDGGGGLDGFTWPDLSTFQYDYGFTYDGAGASADGAAAPDDGGAGGGDGSSGGTSCTSPPEAQCSSCSAGQLCSAAKSGTCTTAVVLTGPASDKAVLRAVALAYVDCWNKAPSSDTLCAAFDSCAMTGTLTESMVEDWVCNMAQKSDFPSTASYDTAQDLLACSWYNLYRPDWRIKTLIGGEKGAVCLSYDVDGDWLYNDYLQVNACLLYPPK